jgi:hypothetical protein
MVSYGALPGAPLPGDLRRERGLSDAEVDRESGRRAIRVILSSPATFVGPMAEKFMIFWRPFPREVALHGEETGQTRAWLYRVVAAATLLPLLVLAPLGVVLARSRWREVLLFVGLIATFTAVHMVFTAYGRYRVPIVPYLMLLAAVPVDRIVALAGASWTGQRAVSTPVSLARRDAEVGGRAG